MPGPVEKPVVTVTPNLVAGAETVVSEPATVTPPKEAPATATATAEIPPPIPTNEGTAMSAVVAGSVVMPAIVFKHPRVAGETIVDRGEDAEFLVLHRRFGEFTEGSRISFEDIESPADLPSFLKLGAIAALDEDGEILPPEAVAERLKDWTPPKVEPAATKKRGR